MVMALDHPQNIFGHVFARHKPRGVFPAAALCAFFFDAADAQTLTLAQRVKTQAHMFADGATRWIFNRTWLFRNIAI